MQLDNNIFIEYLHRAKPIILKDNEIMKHIFDFEDGNFFHSISKTMGINSDGNILLKLSDNMSVDMESGDVHLTSTWEDDEE